MELIEVLYTAGKNPHENVLNRSGPPHQQLEYGSRHMNILHSIWTLFSPQFLCVDCDFRWKLEDKKKIQFLGIRYNRQGEQVNHIEINEKRSGPSLKREGGGGELKGKNAREKEGEKPRKRGRKKSQLETDVKMFRY